MFRSIAKRLFGKQNDHPSLPRDIGNPLPRIEEAERLLRVGDFAAARKLAHEAGRDAFYPLKEDGFFDTAKGEPNDLSHRAARVMLVVAWVDPDLSLEHKLLATVFCIELLTPSSNDEKVALRVWREHVSGLRGSDRKWGDVMAAARASSSENLRKAAADVDNEEPNRMQAACLFPAQTPALT